MNFDEIGIGQGNNAPLLFRLQFAQKKAWERAIRMDFPIGANFPIEFMPAIMDMTEPAVEFFFRLADKRRCFFGARWSPACSLDAPADFVLSALELCGEGAAVTFESVRSWIKVISRSDHQLFSRCPEFLEIGIVDSWRDPPSHVIWQLSHGKDWPLDALAQLPPYLQETDINYIAIEAGYRSPLDHWFGLEISHKNKLYQIDPLSLSSIAQWMLT